MKVKSLTKVAGLSAALLFAGQASADIITEWNWILNAGWTDATVADQSDPRDIDPDAAGDEGFSTLTWGTDIGDGRSNLVIGDNLDGSLTLVDIGGGVYSSGRIDGTEFTHNNRVITGSTFTAAELTEWFKLSAVSNPLIAAIDEPIFDIAFLETSNRGGDLSRCNQAPQESQTACDDLFLILNPEDLTRNFVIDGFAYTVTIGQEGLKTPAELGDEGICGDYLAETCLGLVTEEDNSNTFLFFFEVTARAVPEPSALALLGLGLLGLGYGRRRSLKKK